MKSNTPTLRFPEFSGEWERHEFEDFVDLGKHKYDPKTSANSLKSIELESIESGTGILLKFFNSKEQKSIKMKFQKGDILFGKLRPYLKKYLLAPFDGVCTTEIWVLKSKIDNRFVFYLVQNDRFNRVVNVQSGSKMPRAEWSLVSNSLFSIPTNKTEQRKIASFLTAIDDKIAAVQKKAELLKKYKKGVMQKIFSQEIRFRPAPRSLGEVGDENGNEYPEWEEKRFEEVLVNRTSKPYQIQGNEYQSVGKYPVVDQGQKYVVGYSDKSDRVYKDGPVIIFGDHTTCLKFIDFSFIVGADGTKILTANNKNNLKYLYYFLDLNQLRPEGYKRHFSILKKLKIKLPDIKEQQKIAAFLTAIDDKIALEERRLQQAKRFKKSLLQQMFV